jgi:hypothetical protein
VKGDAHHEERNLWMRLWLDLLRRRLLLIA